MIAQTKFDILKQILIIAQKWQERADRVVEKQIGITSRQWMLMYILEEKFKDHLPSLGEATQAFGTSRQNTKRLANELQKKGFVLIVNDPVDHRLLRLVLTGKHRQFLNDNKNNEIFQLLTDEYFSNLNDQDILIFKNTTDKLLSKIENII